MHSIDPQGYNVNTVQQMGLIITLIIECAIKDWKTAKEIYNLSTVK